MSLPKNLAKKRVIFYTLGVFAAVGTVAGVCGKLVEMKYGMSREILARILVDERKPASAVHQIDWKKLYHKLLVRNIEKNFRKDLDGSEREKELDLLKERTLYYNEKDFNETYKLIVGQEWSEQSYKARDLFLGKKSELAKIRSLDDFDEFAPQSDAARLFEIIKSEREAGKPNYFETEAGKAVMRELKDTVLVVVPGFGSHTIKDYTYPEIVEEANEYYGREKVRPAGMNHADFYGNRNSKRELTFDVVHPMGMELGNSMGRDEKNAKKLVRWLKTLPKEYHKKKLILIGYSKGSPICHEAVRQDAEIRRRTKVILTIAGATQGALPAQSGMDVIMKTTGKRTPMEAAEEIRKSGESAMTQVGGLVVPGAGAALALLKNPSIQDALKTSGVDPVQMLSSLTAQGEAKAGEQLEAFEGVADLSNMQRFIWTLKNLKDQTFDSPITIMNLTPIANLRDFFIPGRVDQVPMLPPTTIPQYTGRKDSPVDQMRLSQDNIFLHLTSLVGFRQAPGGLFDAQVAWPDTKSMALDTRPLSETLPLDQLRVVYDEANIVGMPFEYFANRPRNEVLMELNTESGRQFKNVDFFDLGELRGTHWDSAFRQVYHEDVADYYTHTFPRKANMTAIVETMALFNAVKRESERNPASLAQQPQFVRDPSSTAAASQASQALAPAADSKAAAEITAMRDRIENQLRSEPLVPTLLLGQPKEPRKTIAIMNLMTNSVGYGVWMNNLINGSGTHSYLKPKKMQPLSDQMLRTLSIYDLYRTYGVWDLEQTFDKPAAVSYFTAQLSKDFLDDQSVFRNDPLKQGNISLENTVLEPLLPLVAQTVKELPSQDSGASEQDIGKFLTALRASAMARMKSQFPYRREPENHVERMAYTWNTFRPLAARGEIRIEKPQKTGGISRQWREIFMPQIGMIKTTNDLKNSNVFPDWGVRPLFMNLSLTNEEIKTDMANVSVIAYPDAVPSPKDEEKPLQLAKDDVNLPRMMKIRTDKWFNKANRDRMKVMVSFGKMNPGINGLAENNPMNFQLGAPDEVPVARGYVNLARLPLPDSLPLLPKDPKARKAKKAWVNEKASALNPLLNNVRLRISIHQIALELLRRPSEGQTDAEYKKAAFEDNWGISTIRAIPDESIYTLTVYTDNPKSMSLAKKAALKAWDVLTSSFPIFGQAVPSSDTILLALTKLGFTCPDDGSQCFLMSSQLPEFAKTPLNGMIMKEVANAVNSSVDNQIDGGKSQIDATVEKLFLTILQQIKEGRVAAKQLADWVSTPENTAQEREMLLNLIKDLGVLDLKFEE